MPQSPDCPLTWRRIDATPLPNTKTAPKPHRAVQRPKRKARKMNIYLAVLATIATLGVLAIAGHLKRIADATEAQARMWAPKGDE